ncbi:hypothetical protein LTS18_003931, partial [Coniosporium uncinatum]
YSRVYRSDPSSGSETQVVGQKTELENEDVQEVRISETTSVPRQDNVLEPAPVILTERREERLSEKGKENEEKAKRRGEEEAERERERWEGRTSDFAVPDMMCLTLLRGRAISIGREVRHAVHQSRDVESAIGISTSRRRYREKSICKE